MTRKEAIAYRGTGAGRQEFENTGLASGLDPTPTRWGEDQTAPVPEADRLYQEFINNPIVGNRYYFDKGQESRLTSPGWAYNEVGYKPGMLQYDANGEASIPRALQDRWGQLYNQRNPERMDFGSYLPFILGSLGVGAAASGAFAGAAGAAEGAGAVGGAGAAGAGGGVTSSMPSWLSNYVQSIGTPEWLGKQALSTGVKSLFNSGGSGGGGGGGVTGGGGNNLGGGKGMFDDFDWSSLIGGGADSYDPSMWTTGINAGFDAGGGLASGLQTMTPQLAQQLTMLGYSGADIAAAAGGSGQALLDGLGSGFNSFTSGAGGAGGGGSLFDGMGSSLLKTLLGSNNNGSNKSIMDSLFGSGNGLLSTAMSTAPALAAINYARNQDPYDTSRLTSLYSQYSPEAQAGQYDVNTGLGRNTLTSNLARRGMSGSSFGDQSLTNFNTARDTGRASLINQGTGVQAGIAGQILNADVEGRKSKNELYGRALMALSGGLNPTSKLGLWGRG